MQLSKEAEMPRDLSEALDPSGGALRIADLPAQVTPTRGHLRQLFIARNAVLLVGSIGVAGLAGAEPALRSPGNCRDPGGAGAAQLADLAQAEAVRPRLIQPVFAADPRRCRAPIRGDVRLGRRRKSPRGPLFRPVGDRRSPRRTSP